MYGEEVEDLDRLAVARRGLEAPAPHRVERGLVETEVKTAQNLELGHPAVLVDHRLEHDVPFESGELGGPRVVGLHALDEDRAGDAAAGLDRGVVLAGRGRTR